jgi:urea transport system permease protein
VEIFFLQIFNGLSLASIYLLAALGLAITFGLMGIINMAHGEFIMIGAYTTYLVQNFFKAHLPAALFDWFYLISLPASFLTAAVLGLLLELLIVRRLYRRVLDSLLVTWGVSLVLQQLARSVFGAANVGVSSPVLLDKSFQLGPLLVLSYKRVFIMALAFICVASFAFIMYRTRIGRNIRATMQNRQMASSLGVNTRQVDAATFAIGSGFAGVSGCAITLLGAIGPTVGASYIVDTFMTVVVGGVGRIAGVLSGAAIMGVGNTSFEFLTTASLGKVIIFTVVILILQFRPKGIFTTHSRDLD